MFHHRLLEVKIDPHRQRVKFCLGGKKHMFPYRRNVGGWKKMQQQLANKTLRENPYGKYQVFEMANSPQFSKSMNPSVDGAFRCVQEM